jgi:hypothetical protein
LGHITVGVRRFPACIMCAASVHVAGRTRCGDCRRAARRGRNAVGVTQTGVVWLFRVSRWIEGALRIATSPRQWPGRVSEAGSGREGSLRRAPGGMGEDRGLTGDSGAGGGGTGDRRAHTGPKRRRDVPRSCWLIPAGGWPGYEIATLREESRVKRHDEKNTCAFKIRVSGLKTQQRETKSQRSEA